MRWEKLGRVYVSDNASTWAKWGAFVPTAKLMGDFIRIYAAFFDDNHVGRIGYVDVNASDPTCIIKVSDKIPSMDIGRPGTFDDNGVAPCSIVDYNGKMYLYYIGFQLGVKVRYYIFGGLAISEDGGETFIRYSEVPILDRTDDSLYLRASPVVIIDEGIWKMWYLYGNEWIKIYTRQVPVYRIKYCESLDGKIWPKEGIPAIDFESEDEFGFGRTSVIKENGIFKMFLSIRHKSIGYRLGYAESVNGYNWVRKDSELNLDVSDDGWDSESMQFASVVDYNDSRYLFYNGAHSGRTGFGVACLVGG